MYPFRCDEELYLISNVYEGPASLSNLFSNLRTKVTSSTPMLGGIRMDNVRGLCRHPSIHLYWLLAESTNGLQGRCTEELRRKLHE